MRLLLALCSFLVMSEAFAQPSQSTHQAVPATPVGSRELAAPVFQSDTRDLQAIVGRESQRVKPPAPSPTPAAAPPTPVATPPAPVPAPVAAPAPPIPAPAPVITPPAPAPAPTLTPAPVKKEPEAESSPPSHNDRLFDELLIAFNGLLAFFAWRLWRATAGVWKAVRQQAQDLKRSVEATERMAAAALRSTELAERSLSASDRPWVGAEDILVASLQPHHVPDVIVQIKNSGKTPALDARLQCYGHIVSSADAPPTIPPPGEVESARGVLLPGGTVYAHPFHGGDALSQTQLQAVHSGRINLWITARIDYLDAGGHPHMTTLRMQYLPHINAFAAGAEGNYAD